jgi:hypothetical protein
MYTVKNASIKHMGENTLSFSRHMIELNEFKNEIKNETELNEQLNQKAVYFDLFGIYMICYSIETANLINYSILVIGIMLLLQSFFSEGVLSIFDRLLSIFCLFSNENSKDDKIRPK